jgi:hypothetical protein
MTRLTVSSLLSLRGAQRRSNPAARVSARGKCTLKLLQMPHLLFAARLAARCWIASLRSQ